MHRDLQLILLLSGNEILIKLTGVIYCLAGAVFGAFMFPEISR